MIYHFLAAALSAQRTKKVQESNAKIPAQKVACDLLSPYVGIIQIRFWVKASAYSQPACASTPFSLSLSLRNGLFYNSFIIHACSQNASFLFCAFLKLSQIQLHSHIRYFAISQLIFNIPTKSVVPLQ